MNASWCLSQVTETGQQYGCVTREYIDRRSLIDVTYLMTSLRSAAAAAAAGRRHHHPQATDGPGRVGA